MRIFVSSPLRAITPALRESNVALAKRLCAVVLQVGHAPFVPHVFYQDAVGDGWRDLGKEWLRMADELWVYAESLEACSAGMKSEIEFAVNLNLPPRVKFMPDAFRGVK